MNRQRENESDAPESALPFKNLQAAVGLGKGVASELRVWASTKDAIRARGYTIMDVIGDGATAVVLRALDPRGKRHLALKVIVNPADQRSLCQYLRENQVLGGRNLPASIVRYFGCIEVPTHAHQPVLILEHIEGRSLREYLKSARIGVERRIQLCRQLLSEVASLHDHDVLWADLSHNNMLIDTAGRMRFIDFGVSGEIGRDGRSITSVHGGIGTLTIAAPEVLKGRRPEPRDDLRAAAAVCHLILGGKSVDHETPSGRETRPRRDLLNELVTLGVPRDFAAIVVEALITSESADGKAASHAVEVRERIEAWFATRQSNQMWKRGLALASALLVLLGASGQWLWREYRAAAAQVEESTNVVLAGELGRRTNVGHPALARPMAAIDELERKRSAAIQQGDAQTVTAARRDLVDARRNALSMSHELEAAEPLRASLGEVLVRTPWQRACPTIAGREEECGKRLQVLGAQLDAGGLQEAWGGLRALQIDLARLTADNVAAQRAAAARADFRRIERGVAQRLREHTRWQPLRARADEAEALLVRGRFDDSTGTGAATEYAQVRAQLEAFLVEQETSEERRERLTVDATRVAELEQRISALELQVREGGTQLTSLQGLLARTESERGTIGAARDALQAELTSTREERDAVTRARDQAAVELVAAVAARQAGDAEVGRLKGDIAAAQQARAKAESDLTAARSELANAQRAPDEAAGLAQGPGSKHVNGIGQRMIRVAPGTFQMGSPASEAGRHSDELRHKVTLTRAFWLAETGVTQKQWLEVMGTRPWRRKSYVIEGDDVAATYVSWTDAVEFCRKLTERERGAGRLPEGHEYRLPTEAEREYATRAGTSTAYCFGNAEIELGKYAVYDGARDGEHAHKVKSRKPNAWGFYDLHGNVWEWCMDAADYQGGVVSDAYRAEAVDPVGRSGPRRVLRGGSWGDSAAHCRSAPRYAFVPGCVFYALGFRPVLAARSDVE